MPVHVSPSATTEPQLRGAAVFLDTGTPATGAGIVVSPSSTAEPQFRGAGIFIDSGAPATGAGIVVSPSATAEPQLRGAAVFLDSGTPATGTGVVVSPSGSATPQLRGAAVFLGSDDPLATIALGLPEFRGAGIFIDTGAPVVGTGVVVGDLSASTPEFRGAGIVASVPIPISLTADANRKRSSAYWSDYWTKASDFDHLREMQDLVHSRLTDDHVSTTGLHPTDDWTVGLDGVALGDSTTDRNIAAAVDDTVTVDDGNTTTRAANTITDMPRMVTDVYGLIAICKGQTASGGEAEAVYAPALASLDELWIRRTQASPAAASDFRGRSTWSDAPALRIGAFSSGSPSGTEQRSSVVRRDYLTTVEGTAVPRNFYDRIFRNAETIRNALAYRHNGTNLSDAIALEEFRNSFFKLLHNKTLSSADTYTTWTVKAHAGAYICLVPCWCDVKSGGVAASERIALMPAWDDTNCYLVGWRAPGVSWSGSTTMWLAAVGIPLADLAPGASFTGSFDGAFNVTQGNAIDIDAADPVGKLVKNDEILDKLFLAEHRSDYSGAHALSLDRLTGYRMVLNAVAITASGTPGGVVSQTIEAWPGTAAIYLGALKGAAGSGIRMLSFGGDETSAKAYIRTVTAGTSNAMTLTVVAIDRV